LKHLKLNYPLLVISSALIEVTANYLLKGKYHDIILDFTFDIHLIVYTLLFLFLNYNIKSPGFKFIAIGSLFNFVTILFNKGFMVVDTAMLNIYQKTESLRILEKYEYFGHKAYEENAEKFYYLADIINLPPPYPLPKTVSIGDILLSIGVSIYIYKSLTKEG
jgi:hypothetical protein